MEQQWLWSTNKAHFHRDPDGVRKRYYGSGDAMRDHALLDQIGSSFSPATIDGWLYRPLRVLSVYPESNELLMEYLEGDDLGRLFARSRDPFVFRHAGRWLGAMHTSTATSDGTVIAFNDYNRTNIIVDEVSRAVVAVDPGTYTSVRVHPSQSFVMGAFSITRVALRFRTPPFRPLRHYVAGYLEGSGRESPPATGPGVRYLMSRFWQRRSHAPIPRPAFLRILSGASECLFLSVLIPIVSVRRLQVRSGYGQRASVR